MVLVISVSLALCALMVGAWALQRALGNAGWVDVVWSFATGAAGMVYALAPASGFHPGPRAWLVAALAGLWAVRLGLHLAFRTAGAQAEDARYAGLRQTWGAAFEARLLGFLEIQALAAALLALAILAAARNPAPGPAWSDFAGAALLFLAILGEGVADAQLARFKARHRGEARAAICEEGLWAWSRHPNYFFEWLAWLAWPLMAIGPAGRWAPGYAALLAPALMFWLLRFASGVPATEAAMARSRGAAFEAYRRRTPAFFPRPPAGHARAQRTAA